MWTENDRWFGERDFDTEEEMTDDIDLTLAVHLEVLARSWWELMEQLLSPNTGGVPPKGPGHVGQKI